MIKHLNILLIKLFLMERKLMSIIHACRNLKFTSSKTNQQEFEILKYYDSFKQYNSNRQSSLFIIQKHMSSLNEQPLEYLLSLIQSLQYSNSELITQNQKCRKQCSMKDKWSKSEINLLLQQNTRILSLNAKLESSIRKIAQMLEEKQQVVDQLKTRLFQFQGQMNEVQHEYGGYFTEISQLKNKNNLLSNRVVKIKEQLKQRDIRIQYLEKELEHKRKQINSHINLNNRKSISPRRPKIASSNPQTNISKSRSQPKQLRSTHSRKKQFDGLKSQIESMMATLDQMNMFTEQKQCYIKLELGKKYQEFRVLKQQCQRVKSLYEQDIERLKIQNFGLKKQINQMKQNFGKQTTQQSNNYYLQVINNCLVHKLHYISSIKEELPQAVFEIIANIQSLIITLEESTKQSSETHIDQSIYIQKIEKLQQQFQEIQIQHKIESQKLEEEFMLLEQQRAKLVLSLQLQIKEKQSIIEALEEQKQQILTKWYNLNRLNTQSDQINIGNQLLEISEENSLLKLKNFECLGLIQALLHFLANLVLQWQTKNSMNVYYRICEKYYWQTSKMLGSSTQNSKAKESPKNKFKKVFKCVFFSCCLKVAKRRHNQSQRLSLSDLEGSTANQKFLNLLVQNSDFTDRQQNRAVQQFRQKPVTNMFQELVQMISTQINNKQINRLRNQCMFGYVLFDVKVKERIQSFKRNLGQQDMRAKRLCNSRSVGMFKKARC